MKKILPLAFLLLISMSQPAPAESESEFYSSLMKKQTATVEDAVRLLARYKGYAGHSDMVREMDFLFKQNVRFRKDILELRQSPVTAGNTAHLMIESAGLRGGVMAWVFRSNQRYALRQAVHLGLMPDDVSVDDVLSGRDLLGFVSKLAQISTVKKR